MSQGANVRSVEALVQFKNGLVAFSEDARVILDGVQMEIRRTRNWLERDQLTYWRSQVKRWQQEVAMARTELHRRKLTQMNSDVVTDTEQKEALKLAQRRLAHAEEMVEKVKRWIPVLEHAIADYRAQAQPLGDHLSGGFENTLSLLDRMVKSLDAYLKLSAPAAPVLPAEMSSGNETAASGGFTSASNGPAEVEKPKESSGEEPAAEAPTASGAGSLDHREPV